MARKFAAELEGLKEMRLRFTDIAKAMGMEKPQALTTAAKGITEGFSAAALFVRDKARSNASGKGIPRRLYTGSSPAIFAFSDFNSSTDDKRKRSSLVGVRTGLSSRAKDPRLFIQWGIGAKRRKDGSVAGRGLAMSFGALFERGTKDRRIRAARFFRNAVFSTRGAVAQILTAAYQRAIDAINRTK